MQAHNPPSPSPLPDAILMYWLFSPFLSKLQSTMNTRVRSFNHLALLLLSDASRSETSLIVYGSEIFYRSVTFLPNHVFPAGLWKGCKVVVSLILLCTRIYFGLVMITSSFDIRISAGTKFLLAKFRLTFIRDNCLYLFVSLVPLRLSLFV